MKKILQKVNDFWFSPGYTKDISLIHFVVVGLQLYFLLFNDVLVAQKVYILIEESKYDPPIFLKILLLPFGWGARPEYMFIETIWLGAIITGFTSLFGLYKRVSLFLFASFTTILVTHSYAYWNIHHNESVLIIFLWILAFGSHPRSWSVDDLRRRITASVSRTEFIPREKNAVDIYATWPVRLMQIIFCLVYFSAGFEKILAGFNTYTLTFFFATGGKELGVRLAQHPEILNVMVWFTYIFETTFIIILFFRGLTWIYILIGTAFHVSVYFIQGPAFLHWPLLYIAFIDPIRNTIKNTIRKRIKWKIKSKPKWDLIFDGGGGKCPLCIRTITFLNYFDLRNKLNYLDFNSKSINKELKYEELNHSMHLVDPAGRVYKGFYAFQKLSVLLPVLWFLIPVLHFPLVDKIGNYLYSKVSGNRKTVHCTEACRAEERIQF